MHQIIITPSVAIVYLRFASGKHKAAFRSYHLNHARVSIGATFRLLFFRYVMVVLLLHFLVCFLGFDMYIGKLLERTSFILCIVYSIQLYCSFDMLNVFMLSSCDWSKSFRDVFIATGSDSRRRGMRNELMELLDDMLLIVPDAPRDGEQQKAYQAR